MGWADCGRPQSTPSHNRGRPRVNWATGDQSTPQPPPQSKPGASARKGSSQPMAVGQRLGLAGRSAAAVLEQKPQRRHQRWTLGGGGEWVSRLFGACPQQAAGAGASNVACDSFLRRPRAEGNAVGRHCGGERAKRCGKPGCNCMRGEKMARQTNRARSKWLIGTACRLSFLRRHKCRGSRRPSFPWKLMHSKLLTNPVFLSRE